MFVCNQNPKTAIGYFNMYLSVIDYRNLYVVLIKEAYKLEGRKRGKDKIKILSLEQALLLIKISPY